jgi:hypothetical protein
MSSKSMAAPDLMDGRSFPIIFFLSPGVVRFSSSFADTGFCLDAFLLDNLAASTLREPPAPVNRQLGVRNCDV